jgi:type II secretory pathway pseudopilin PulG
VINVATRNFNCRRAFTLVEVLVAAMAAIILIVGVSAMLFYGQRGYNTMYRRVNSEVVRNAYEARRVFDAVVRKSTVERCDILSPDDIYGEIFLYYYYDEAQPDAPAPEPIDRYRYIYPAQPDSFARFYVIDTDASDKLELYVEHGKIPPGIPWFLLDPASLRGTGTSMLLAKNVVSCRFRNTGTNSVQMILTLDDETNPAPNIYSKTQTLKMVVTTTAIRQSKIRE